MVDDKVVAIPAVHIFGGPSDISYKTLDIKWKKFDVRNADEQ